MQQSNVILPYIRRKNIVAYTPTKLHRSIKLSKYTVYNPIIKNKSKTMSDLHPLGLIRPTSGCAFQTVIRFSHTDIKVPDYTFYRRKTTTNPVQKSSNNINDRCAFTYTVTGLGTLGAAYSLKNLATFLLSTMAASADVLAIAKIEVSLSDIPEGKTAIFKWRGKPLFVKHRSEKDIETERAVPISILRDPETDEERCKRPDFLVMLGICTHLGCVPIPNSGDFPGGFYCPCHGSHYDGAGRIRKGPAPLNMEVPEHYYLDENTLVVG